MIAILGLVLPLLMLGFVFRLLFRSPMRFTGFSSRRAGFALRSRTGGNAALALAAINLAQLALELGKANTAAGSQVHLGAWIILALVLAFVFTLVAADREAGFLLAVAGIAAGVLSTALDLGWAAVVALLVFAMLLVWTLGFVRGLLRPLA